MADLLKEDDDVLIEEGKQEDEIVEVEVSEDEDKRLSAEESGDDDREAIRERRRKEKVERKERRDKAINRDRLEMDFLRQRNDDLERRLSAQEHRAHQTDLSLVDQQLQEAVNQVNMAERVIAKAVEAGNGEDVTQAMRYRDEAMARAHQINAYKHQQAQRPTAAPRPADNPADTVAMEYAREFIKDNDWYDPAGRDEDSAIVLAIDNALVNEGMRPDTEEYWDELRNRVKRRLPDKGAPARQPRGGPAVGSGREHAPTSTRREVYISPERKQALIDAGVWDDPTLRQKYIKKYMEYDRDNRAQ